MQGRVSFLEMETEEAEREIQIYKRRRVHLTSLLGGGKGAPLGGEGEEKGGGKGAGKGKGNSKGKGKSKGPQ